MLRIVQTNSRKQLLLKSKTYYTGPKLSRRNEKAVLLPALIYTTRKPLLYQLNQFQNNIGCNYISEYTGNLFDDNLVNFVRVNSHLRQNQVNEEVANMIWLLRKHNAHLLADSVGTIQFHKGGKSHFELHNSTKLKTDEVLIVDADFIMNRLNRLKVDQKWDIFDKFLFLLLLLSFCYLAIGILIIEIKEKAIEEALLNEPEKIWTKL